MNNKPSQAERLAAIERRQAELDRLIARKERKMRMAADELFSSKPVPKGGMASILAHVGLIATVADGALTGYRLFRRLRRIIK